MSGITLPATKARGQSAQPGENGQKVEVKQGPYIVQRGEPVQRRPCPAVLELCRRHRELQPTPPRDHHEHHAECHESLYDHGITDEMHMNYSGATTHNFFKVSHSIELTTLFFYGPWGKDGSRSREVFEYEVYVSIWEGICPEDGAVKIAEFKAWPAVHVGELMVVYIPYQIFLRAQKWHTVKFILDGQETVRMAEEPETHVHVHVDGFGTVKFDFLAGSKQMPQMEFWIVTGKEKKLAAEQWILRQAYARFQPRVSLCDVACDWLISLFI